MEWLRKFLEWLARAFGAVKVVAENLNLTIVFAFNFCHPFVANTHFLYTLKVLDG